MLEAMSLQKGSELSIISLVYTGPKGEVDGSTDGGGVGAGRPKGVLDTDSPLSAPTGLPGGDTS